MNPGKIVTGTETHCFDTNTRNTVMGTEAHTGLTRILETRSHGLKNTLFWNKKPVSTVIGTETYCFDTNPRKMVNRS